MVLVMVMSCHAHLPIITVARSLYHRIEVPHDNYDAIGVSQCSFISAKLLALLIFICTVLCRAICHNY